MDRQVANENWVFMLRGQSTDYEEARGMEEMDQ